MLKLAQLTKRYPGGFEALQQINLNLARGEMAFLTGHSGAGKTSLLKLIALLEPASSGQILYEGKNLCKLPRRQVPGWRQQLGIIFQNPQLLDDRSVFDNVALPLVVAGMPHQEIKKRARAALDKVGLLRKEKVNAVTLSAGEQQRIGIARAVINKPRILLADEPTGNLDPQLAADIMALFEAFNRVGVTVLIATHDLALIASLPYRILTLRQGRLLNGDPLDEADK